MCVLLVLEVIPASSLAHMHNGYQSSLNVGSKVLPYFILSSPGSDAPAVSCL